MLVGIQGLMGAGKTYTVVNRFMRAELMKPTPKGKQPRKLYTNIPLNVEPFIRNIARDLPTREELRDRIVILEDEDEEAFHPDTGESLGEKNKLREFWYFIEPGSVIFLDEIAEIWPSEDYRKRPEGMPSFINQHRKVFVDVYFCLQRMKDVDTKLRKKLQYIYTVTNSLKASMFPGVPMLKGWTWPWQFFIVHEFEAAQFNDNTDGDLSTRADPMDTFKVWPKKWGFRNYESFALTAKMDFLKKDPSKEGELQSSDAGIKATDVLLKNLGRSAGIFLFVVSMLVGVCWGGYTIWAEVSAVSKVTVEGTTTPRVQDNGVNSGAVSSSSLESSRPVLSVGSVAVGEELEEIGPEVGRGERVLMLTPVLIETNKRVLRVGSLVEIGGKSYELEGIQSEEVVIGGVVVPLDQFLSGIGAN